MRDADYDGDAVAYSRVRGAYSRVRYAYSRVRYAYSRVRATSAGCLATSDEWKRSAEAAVAHKSAEPLWFIGVLEEFV